MRTLVYLVGGFFILAGTFVILYTATCRRALESLGNALSPRVLAVIPIMIGGLLIVSGPWSREFWVVEVLGVVSVLKGVLMIVLPASRMDRFISRWTDDDSDTLWRLGGTMWVVLGTFLFFRG
jgi:hypothetical protein